MENGFWICANWEPCVAVSQSSTTISVKPTEKRLSDTVRFLPSSCIDPVESDTDDTDQWRI